MILSDPPFIGDWFKERTLGSGSFGMVTLWKNNKTKELIAIKKCHVLKGNTEKQGERWKNELELMKNVVKNENIVKTITVESESFLKELMKTNSSGLPFLIMEYCEGGDLRRVLNKNINCSGLKESEVRAILKSLRNAISYLHSLKITHRDIKPENIVLKQFGDVTVYKLTDLGYARALDIESLNASLVGTMEYLAPEFLMNGKYNNSVDYWSMGIICFEIISGHRPFIPHASFAQWIVQVQQKKSQHIYITEDVDGKYIFSNQLCTENRISKCLKILLEKWLTIALEWNPKQRGYIFELTDNCQMDLKTSARPKSVTFADSIPFNGNAPVQVLKIFTLLDEIFSEKILTVFCLYTYEFLYFIINENTTMAILYEWIHTETGIDIKNIEIILPLEQTIDHINSKTRPIDFYLSNYYEKPMIYIARRATIALKKTEKILNDEIKPKIPEIISNLFKNDKVTLRPHILKLFANNSYYFIKHEKLLYETMMNGIRDYGFYLNHQITIFKQKINAMTKLIFGIQGSLELYRLTVELHKKKILLKSPDNMDSKFIACNDQMTRMDGNLSKLSDATEKILTRYESVLRRSREQNNKIFEKSFLSTFDIDILDKCYDQIKNEILDKKVNDKSHSKMLQFVYHSLKQRDMFLRDDEFIKLQKHLENVQIEIDEIKKTVEKAILQGEKYKTDVVKMHTEFMEIVWTLIEQNTKSEAGAIFNNGYSAPDFASIFEQLNIDPTHNTRKNFQIGVKVLPDGKNAEILCFGEGPDLNSVLADNESINNAMNDLLEDGFKSLSDQYESLNINFTY